MREMGMAISRCRGGCAASVRRSTAGRRGIGRHWMGRGTTGLSPRCNVMYLPAAAIAGEPTVRETERRLAAEDGFEGAQFAFPDPEEVFVRAPQPTVEQ